MLVNDLHSRGMSNFHLGCCAGFRKVGLFCRIELVQQGGFG